MYMKNEDAPPYGASNLMDTISEGEVVAKALQIIKNRLAEPGAVMSSPQVVKDYLTIKLSDLEHEVFAALWLDSQNRLIQFGSMFRGTLTQASVYPREVVKEALRINAGAVIFAHNHPSGMPEPSRADEMLTKTLQDALALVEVKVLDHIIVGGTTTVSLGILRFLDALLRRAHGAVLINCLTNGSHRPGSKHYAGEAVDIDKTSGVTSRDLQAAASEAGVHVLDEDSAHWHAYSGPTP